MEVKTSPRPVVASPITAPVLLPEQAPKATAPRADGFVVSSITPQEGAQAPVEGASAGELWGAGEVAEADALGGAAKPSFEGVTLQKDRWGNTGLVFTVKAGDTLSALSRRSGVDVGSLVNHNHLEDPNQLSVGQKIGVPTTFHEVKKGETYWGIAQQSGIPVQLLMQLNDAPKDALLRVGQELRVPASVTSPAQQQLRAELVAVLDDTAAATSRMYFGPGSFRPFHVGNDLGFMGVADSDSRYQFSDDFRTVKVSHGQSGAPPTVYRLDAPAVDLGRIVTTDTIRAMANLRAESLKEAFPDFPGAFNVIGPRKEQGGSVGFTITGPADGDTYLSYDPRQGTLSLSDNSDRTVTVKAERPTDVVNALKKHFELKLPLYA